MPSFFTRLRRAIDQHIFSILVILFIILSGALLSLGSHYFEHAIKRDVNAQLGAFMSENFPTQTTEGIEDINHNSNP